MPLPSPSPVRVKSVKYMYCTGVLASPFTPAPLFWKKKATASVMVFSLSCPCSYPSPPSPPVGLPALEVSSSVGMAKVSDTYCLPAPAEGWPARKSSFSPQPPSIAASSSAPSRGL